MKQVQPKDGESADIVADNIEQLQALFPEAFSEGGVNFDVLRQLLGDARVLDEGEEKYGLDWHGKKKARQIALMPSTATLLPCREESVAWDTTKNLFIEGDNLAVLKLLQKSYANQVKVIYIDPPYNTGKEFIYPDRFQQNLETYLKYTGQIAGTGAKFSTNTETAGRKHTNWLNMMYPRLRLARALLSREGAIFISIGEDEVENLRTICTDIFGEDNFIATVVWQKVFSPKNTAQYFSEDHDYILIYSKNKAVWRPELLPRSDNSLGRYKNPDNDPRGPWLSGAIQARNYYGKGVYEVTSPSGEKFSNPKGTYWRFSHEKFQELDSDNRIWWGENGANVPRLKRFLSEVKQGVVPQTLWKYKDVGHTQEAKEELLEYVNFEKTENVLNSVKPSRLIKRILQIGTRAIGQDIVLDFFAGSGVTGQAVLEKNHEDNGDRRYILVQLPEPLKVEEKNLQTIADLAKTRVKRTSSLLRERSTSVDIGIKVFRLAASNIQVWNPDHSDLEHSLLAHEQHLLEGRTNTDILYELILKRGLDLAAPVASRKWVGKTIYNIGSGALFACLDNSIAKEQVEAIGQGIVKWRRELAPSSDTQVFFRDSAFSDDVTKTNMVAILERNGITHVRSL
ncbi:MAG: site-specific DNA-methyltransferase [Gammaproteobacteria bacterium]|nr:MAG: site-specific DNA-methyltransferase [Gammaproteobacteria bacterium]